ncbi:MAG: efflux RND transporter periplasmic adaptor subunit [Clostridiales Family XIII bacterium]|jgi:RND family efflux transporter MFP subunit|nr:efflux RND transporter periplasmic adaptor subunit [Clostridiales Family XIII bacterium]
MRKVSSFIKGHKKIVIALAVVVVIIIAVSVLSALGRSALQSLTQEVSVQELTIMDIEQIVTATGTVKGIDSRSVSVPQTNASKIVSVNVVVGQIVEQGEILCVLDTKTLDQNIAATQKSIETANLQKGENVVQAQRRLDAARNQYSYDENRLNAEIQKAKIALDAANDLTTPPAILPGVPTPQAAYDTAVQTRDATLRADNTAIQNASDALTSQQITDTTSQLQNQLNTYLQQKADAIIKAPIGGTVTTVNAKPDSYPGMEGPLFVIENLYQLEVTALVPEFDASLLRTGLGVHIKTDAIQNAEWLGLIKSISPVATDSSGNFTVTISVTSAIEALKSGMSAKLNIVTDSRKGVFAVPYGALGETADGKSVIYVPDTLAAAGGKPGQTETIRREIPVELGLETDYYVEISGPALKEGLLYLTDPEGLTTDSPFILPAEMSATYGLE